MPESGPARGEIHAEFRLEKGPGRCDTGAAPMADGAHPVRAEDFPWNARRNWI